MIFVFIENSSQIGEWGPGQYNLTVTGSGGLRFTNTTALQYVQKSLSVFIQTDKAIYKPGETVRFRIVVVDPQLRPSVTGAIRLQVTVSFDVDVPYKYPGNCNDETAGGRAT